MDKCLSFLGPRLTGFWLCDFSKSSIDDTSSDDGTSDWELDVVEGMDLED